MGLSTRGGARSNPDYPGWNYTRAEILADRVVHALGVGLGLVGATILVFCAATSLSAVALTAVLIYAIALLSMLGISAAYNMWPVSPRGALAISPRSPSALTEP